MASSTAETEMLRVVIKTINNETYDLEVAKDLPIAQLKERLQVIFSIFLFVFLFSFFPPFFLSFSYFFSRCHVSLVPFPFIFIFILYSFLFLPFSSYSPSGFNFYLRGPSTIDIPRSSSCR